MPRAASTSQLPFSPEPPEGRVFAGSGPSAVRTSRRGAGSGSTRWPARCRTWPRTTWPRPLAGPVRLAAAPLRGDRARLPAVRDAPDPADLLLGDRAALGPAHHHRGRARRSADPGRGHLGRGRPDQWRTGAARGRVLPPLRPGHAGPEGVGPAVAAQAGRRNTRAGLAVAGHRFRHRRARQQRHRLGRGGGRAGRRPLAARGSTGRRGLAARAGRAGVSPADAARRPAPAAGPRAGPRRWP